MAEPFCQKLAGIETMQWHACYLIGLNSNTVRSAIKHPQFSRRSVLLFSDGRCPPLFSTTILRNDYDVQGETSSLLAHLRSPQCPFLLSAPYEKRGPLPVEDDDCVLRILVLLAVGGFALNESFLFIFVHETGEVLDESHGIFCSRIAGMQRLAEPW